MAEHAFHIAGKQNWLLFEAVKSGNFKTALKLLGAGGLDVNLVIDGKSLLWHAGQRGYKDIVRLLVQHGGDPNWTYGKQQRSLLHFAVVTGNYGFVSVLLECGANPNSRTTSGATPLHFASRTGLGYIAGRLLEAGASVNARDRQGKTPFCLAIDNNHQDVMPQLSKAVVRGKIAIEEGTFANMTGPL